MKKNIYFLLSFVLLFSCQVDELDQNIEPLNEVNLKSKKHDKKPKDEEKEFQYICHKQMIGNDWKFITLYLPPESIQAHLDHGDAEGVCPNSATDEDGNYTDDVVSNETASCNCSGYVTRLDLRYNGAEVAEIIVTGTKGKKAIYKEKLSPGELFHLNGFGAKGTLGGEINISV